MQRTSYNTVPFGLISLLLIYTPAELFSANAPMSLPDTGLKIKTVQHETFFFPEAPKVAFSVTQS